MVEYTAILNMYLDFLNSLKNKALKKYMYIASLMAVTHLRHQEKNM